VELNSELRKVPNTRDYAEDRADIFVNLIKILLSVQRTDEALRLAKLLCEQHIQHGFYAEAASALLLVATDLTWDGLAQEKEQLYMRIVNLFAKGHVPDRAMSLLHELQLQYEHVADYAGAAQIAERQVAILREATEGASTFATFYYSVTFSGGGAPPELRDTKYIYRTHERLEAFVTSLKRRYPAALVNSDERTPPADALRM